MNEAQDKESVEITFKVSEKRAAWNERGPSYQLSFRGEDSFTTASGVSKELFDNTVIGDVFLLKNISATGEVDND